MSPVAIKPGQHGFSLIELMMTLVVGAILLTIALPSFNAAVERNRLAGAANDFIAATMLARTEAIRRNGAAGICASSDGATCTGSWNQGWMVWADADRDGAADLGEGIRVGSFSRKDTVAAGSTDIRFDARGRRIAPAGALTVLLQPIGCEAGRPATARLLTVSATGGISVTKPVCS